MRRVDVVMMNGQLRVGSPSLRDRMSESLTLQQIEVQSGREHKNFPRVVAANCSS